jgi:hypothetical protein
MSAYAFERAWYIRSSRTWIETSRACRIAGLRSSAALHLSFAGSMRRDAQAATAHRDRNIEAALAGQKLVAA